jgi:DNA relaxase NicK
MGVYVCLSGNAIKQYVKLGGDLEMLMIMTYTDEVINITRLDLAADERDKKLILDYMIQCSRDEKIRTHTRNIEEYSSRKGKIAPAKCMYVGSRKSEQYVRIYDKAKEQYSAKHQPELYNAHWIRVELVLRRERARNAVKYIVESKGAGKELGECFAEMLNGYMQFIELDDTNITRCSVAEWWLNFLETLGSVKLFVTDEIKHVLERKIVWFYDNMAPLVSTMVDAIGDENVLRIIMAGKERRKREYGNMLEVYLRDENAMKLTEILGYEYETLANKYYDQGIQYDKSEKEPIKPRREPDMNK